VYLFAFVPIRFIQEHAVADRQGRYITYEDLQAADKRFSHVTLDQDHVLPRSIYISDESYEALTSPNIGDPLLEALILIDSARDTSSVLDMITNDPDLRKAFQAVNRRSPVANRVTPVQLPVIATRSTSKRLRLRLLVIQKVSP